MKTKSDYFIAVALVISSVLITWVLSERKESALSFVDAGQHAEDLAGITEKLDDLARSLAYMADQKAMAGREVVIESDEEHVMPRDEYQYDGDTVEINAAETEQQELEQVQNIVWMLEYEFGNQVDDSHWSPQVEDAIQSALETDGLSQSALASINCRSTMCRIDVEHINQDAEMTFLSELNVTAGLGDTEAFYTRGVDNNGSVTMTYYLSREGYRLPRLLP